MRVQTAEICSGPGGDLQHRPGTNVVPFMRPDSDAGRAPPLAGIDRDARPAPASATPFARTQAALFIVASLAVHGAVLAAFYRGEAPALASVGERSISIEIVLGTDRAAGIAETPMVAESTVNAPEAEGEAPEFVKPETARAEVKVAEVARDADTVRAPVSPEAISPAAPRPVEAVETMPVDVPAEVKVAEAKPVEQASEDRPAAEAADAEAAPAMPLLASDAPATEAAPLVEVTPPAEPGSASVAAADSVDPAPVEARQVAALPDPSVTMPRPRPEPPRATAKPRQVKPARERPRRAVVRRQRNKRGNDARTRESRTSVASVASSGIGRGRSDDMSNYRGIVAARLARNKQFPPAARRNGDEGRAVVAFTIDRGGRVSRVALVRGTGIASLDHEVRAMVRRAAPFPPPPAQRSVRFTVPVSFNLR